MELNTLAFLIICFSLYFYLRKKLISFRDKIIISTSPPSISLDELKKKYRFQNILLNIFPIIYFVILTAIFSTLLYGISLLTLHLNPSANYHLAPSLVYWLFPSFVFSIILIEFTEPIYTKLFLKDSYSEYQQYIILKKSKDKNDNSESSKKHSIPTSVQYIVLGMPLFLMANWYTYFTENEIVINSFLSITPKEYSYNQIASVYAAQKFKTITGNSIQNRPEYQIVFSDSSKWTTIGEPGDLEIVQKTDIINYVLSKSKQTLKEIDMIIAEY